jgi:purine nucleosidase
MKDIKGYTDCIDTKEHAVNALIRYADKHPNELNLIAIGPLTNIALAIRLDPTFPSKVKSITIMGGTSNALGNMTLSTEFNFRQDPEAAAIVFKEFTNIKLLTWNCSMDTEPKTKKQMDRLYYDNASTPLGEFHRDSCEHFYKLEKRFYITDALCPIAIIDPSSIVKSFKAFGVIETANSMSKGMI